MTWDMHYIDDKQRLVHFAREGYGARRSHEHDGVYPSWAYTRCGLNIMSGENHARAGIYVPHDVMLTCVRCLGQARDGELQRTTHKSIMFGIMYGRSELSMQHLLLGRYGRSIYRRCLRVAGALFKAAIEGPHA